MSGVSLPTVEEMIVNMKIATPTEGLITLSGTANPHLFSMAKVGLGNSVSDHCHRVKKRVPFLLLKLCIANMRQTDATSQAVLGL